MNLFDVPVAADEDIRRYFFESAFLDGVENLVPVSFGVSLEGELSELKLVPNTRVFLPDVS